MAASATDRLMKVGTPGTATTLSAPGYTIGATSITVASTTNWPTDTGVTFAIDQAEVVDGVEVRVDGTYNEFVGTVASGTSITNVDYVAGDAERNFSAGALTRVYIPVSSERENRIVTWGTEDHTQLGYHKTLKDANGNTWLGQTATGSAVNYVNNTNAASGNNPKLEAAGSGTNLDLYLGGKGTGQARHIGPYDGWVAANETLTYASATTFTCSSALAGVLSAGDKIKLTQTTAKYFYVTGVSGTTVTVTGGSDYSLANAAITLPFYSHESSPVGFPQRFNYTPTWTSSGTAPAIVNGTITGQFSITGKNAICTIYMAAGSSTTFGTGDYFWSLPVTSATLVGVPTTGNIRIEDFGTVLFWGSSVMNSTTTVKGVVAATNSVYLQSNDSVAQTVPMTWANGDNITLSFNYQIA